MLNIVTSILFGNIVISNFYCLGVVISKRDQYRYYMEMNLENQE